VRVALEAAPAELIEKYNRQAAAVRSLNARVELSPVAGSAYSGVIEDYRDVRGFILAQKPASVRMIGQAPVVATNIFDMVSDGETFRIHIPSKHKFIVGPADLRRETEKPIENLRPQHLVDAIFWPELDAQARVLFEEFDDAAAAAGGAARRYYVLTVLRGPAGQPEIARKIWFDRADLGVARVQAFDPGGRLATDAHYADWLPAPSAVASAEPLRYPHQIRLARPRDDYRLDVRITKLTLNEEIAADRFQLEQPAGTELVRLTNNPEGKQPEVKQN
jgi:hypothetical protein